LDASEGNASLPASPTITVTWILPAGHEKEGKLNRVQFESCSL
jgi:hypothetical protein